MPLKFLFLLTIAVLMSPLAAVAGDRESSALTELTATSDLASALPARGDLIARRVKKVRTKQSVRVRRSPKKPATKAPAPTPPEAETPTTETPAPTKTPAPAPSSNQPADPNKEVLVTELTIEGKTGALAPDLAAKVRQAISTKVGSPTTRAKLEQDLKAIQALGAFSEVNIVPTDVANGVKLAIVLTPYGPVNRVQIKTQPEGTTTALTQAEIDSVFQSQYGKPLNQNNIQEAVKKLEKVYQDRGFSLAKIFDIEQLSPDGTLVLIAAEGKVENVQVRFLTKDGSPVDENNKPVGGATRDYIITREAELKPGQIFNRDTVQKDLRRIYGLGLFDDVRVSLAPGSDPSQVILQFNVIERKTSSILAGGGISSANGLFGSVSFNQQNLGGNNQKIGAEVQLGTRDLLFDVNYTDPWVGTDSNRLSYNINAFQRRSLSLVFDGGKTPVFLPGTTEVPRVLRQGGGVTFSRPLGGNPYADSDWRMSAGLQYQKVSVRSADGGQIVPRDAQGNDLSFSGTGEDDLFLVQLGATRDLRNNPFDPTEGSLLRFNADQSIPIGNGNISMTRLQGSYTQYFPVKLLNFSPGSQALLFNVRGGTILGSLPPYEAFSLGGTTSVRGYEDGDVGSGRSFVQASAEYRFPIVSIIGGGIFADYGSDLGTGSSVPGNPAGVRGKPGSGFGYGAGVRVQSPLGSIRIDYGINSIGEGRIQFGIGERF